MDEYIKRNDVIDAVVNWDCKINQLTALYKLPSADVAPVVHGRWENYSPITIKCSRCGHVIQDWRYSECKYCPNCGAKMDEHGEE